MRLARAGRAALLVLLMLGVFGWAVSGAEYFLRLAYLTALLLLGSAFWARQALRGISLQRTARLLRATVGEIIEERFEVINAGRWPCLWLEIRNQSSLPLAGGSRLVTNLGPHHRRFYTARHLLLERGLYPLGPTLLTSGDLFGLFLRHRLVPAAERLLVLPMLFDLPHFSTVPSPLPGVRLARRNTADLTPQTTGLREYMPGDPLKRIHWPATARYHRLMAKEFEQESEATVWIFLDAQRAIQTGRPRSPLTWDGRGWRAEEVTVRLAEDTLEYAVSAAASLARCLLRQRCPVGLACSTARPVILPPDRGDRQVDRILETLALLQADGELPFESLVFQQGRFLSRGSHLILITPTARQSFLVAIEDLLERRLYPLVVLLDVQSFGGTRSNQELALALRQRGVAVCQVRCGDDLDQVLRWEKSFRASEGLPAMRPGA
jgi:uncharacterized protein (DUF58 family)